MAKEIKLGVVGFGGRGQGMFRLAVEDMPNVVPVAICDSSPARLEQAQAKYPDTPRFGDFEQMLEEASLDALLVETPATCHAEFCGRALERDIHVMSDIPPVASIEEAAKLWTIGQRTNALFMTGANPNMWAWIDTVIDLRDRGLLGDPYYIECEYIHDCRYLWPTTPWRATYEPIKYCTHDLGPVLRIIDEEFTEVSCFDTGSHVKASPGQHDAMAALLRTRSNIVVRFLASFINNRPSVSHQIRMYTTKGYFEMIPPYLSREGMNCVYHSTELPGVPGMAPLHIDTVIPKYANFAKSGHGGTDHALFDNFFGAIRSGGPSPIPLREGLRMTLPGIYAAQSASNGGALTQIRYPWDGQDTGRDSTAG